MTDTINPVSGDIFTSADKYRNNLDNYADGQVGYAVDRYDRVLSTLDKELADVSDLIMGRQNAGLPIPASWLHKQSRYIDLIDQTYAKVDKYSKVLQEDVGTGAKRTFQMAEEHSAELLDRQLPGYQENIKPFNTLPSGAAEQYMGTMYSERMSPLPAVFDSMGPQASETLDTQILNGIAMGLHPLDVVERAKNYLKDEQLGRAATIARTEMYRSYREANRRVYAQNADVVDKWIWNAHIGDRTCAACYAMHGEEFPVTEPMGGHPNCRCTQIPKTKSWADLGLEGMEEHEPNLGNEGEWVNGQFVRSRTGKSMRSGEARFAALPESEQRKILGPKKFDAYKRGDIILADTVSTRESARWGVTRSVASYDEALLNGQTRRIREGYEATQAQIRQSQIDAALTPIGDNTPAWVADVNKIKADSIAQHGRLTEDATIQIGRTIRKASPNDYGLPPEWEETGERLKVNRARLKKAERAVNLQQRKMIVEPDFDVSDIQPDGTYVNHFGHTKKVTPAARAKYGKLQAEREAIRAEVKRDQNALYTPRFSDPKKTQRFVSLRDEKIALEDRIRKEGWTVDYTANKQKVRDLETELRAMAKDSDDPYLNMPNAIVGQVKQVRPVGSNGMKHTYERHKLHNDEALESFEDSLELFPTDWVETSTKHGPLTIGKTDRGHYKHFGGTPEILTSGRGKDGLTDTMVHEFGHRMEYTKPEIMKLEREFYTRRAGQEKPIKLKTLFPEYNYRADEITRVDNFHTPYVGKDYLGGAYEITSMGVQETLYPRSIVDAMITGGDTPHIVEDAELIDFIVGLLGGV